MKNIIAYFSNHKHLALALAVISAGILAFAYVSQYVFHYDPCILCLYQRKPYFAVIVLAVLAFALQKKHPLWTYRLLLLCAVAFVVGVGISGYHTGVERTWWEGTKSCGDALLPKSATLEEMREYLTNKRITRCEVPSWQLFGLSMTNYNFMQSVVLAGLTTFLAIKGRK